MRGRTNIVVIILSILLGMLLFHLFIRKDNEPKYDSAAIMEKIAYVKELSLVKYNYSGIISYKDYMKFMNLQVPLTEKSFLIKYTGYVKAGIDMSKASVEVNGKHVKVTLPKPEIQEAVIDQKTIQVYDQSMNVLNPIKVEDYQRAIVGEQNKIKQDALNKSILTESSDQAHQFITSLLEELGFETVEIVEAETVKLPTVNELIKPIIKDR